MIMIFKKEIFRKQIALETVINKFSKTFSIGKRNRTVVTDNLFVDFFMNRCYP